MPVKIQNTFTPATPVGEALNNAITSYANTIPTYGEQQEAQINKNKGESPQDLTATAQRLAAAIKANGGVMTPEMQQDATLSFITGLQKGGNLNDLGGLSRAVTANSAHPQSIQMIDRSQIGAGQGYSDTQTGFNTNQANDVKKVQMTNDAANGRNAATISAENDRAAASRANDIDKINIQQKGALDRVNAMNTNKIQQVQQKQGTGHDQVEQVVSNLAGLYKQLDDMHAAINTSNSGAKNFTNSVANSAAGQIVNARRATQAQAIRDQINSQIPLLMLGVKNATGASAQQMNSNQELDFYKQAFGDVGKSVQSNYATLGRLSQQFGTGKLAANMDPKGLSPAFNPNDLVMPIGGAPPADANAPAAPLERAYTDEETGMWQDSNGDWHHP